VSCSDWFTIVNRSPYTFQVSNVSEEANFESLPILRPLTLQSIGIKLNATANLQIEYGTRLNLYFGKDLDRVKLRDIKHDSSISYKYDSDRGTLTLNAADLEIDKFSFIVSSDPQPYRLPENNDSNTDPNAQRLRWLRSTLPVFQRLGKEETDAHLMIVNGDLTEFGRSTQWNTFQLAISGISIPMVYGLGNHDYQNNVEDCGDTDPSETPAHDCMDSLSFHGHSDDSCSDWFPTFPSKWIACCRPNIENLTEHVRDTVESYSYYSKNHLDRLRNSCARRMIERMRAHQIHLAKVLWDFSTDEKSLAYAWNYGSVLRFVQLHNRPNYTVELKGLQNEPTVVIKSSYSWLIADMNAHKHRSYILNIHDAMGHPDLEELRPYFGRVKAIFAGHTHLAGVKCFNGVAIFDSGALFKNEFLRVEFSQGGRCFDVLHFIQNKYASPLAVNYCFQSVLENPCIPN